MRVDVAFFPILLDEARVAGRTAVIIDVLRASTSLITGLGNGAREARLFADPDEARAEKRRSPSDAILLCGERGGEKIPGFDLGNSPREYTEQTVGDKVLLFTSTNGSGAVLKAAMWAAHVILAAFVNATSAIEAVVRSGLDSVVVCAGREGHFSIEDSVCAGLLADGLSRRAGQKTVLTDEAQAARHLFEHFRGDLGSMMRKSEHGRFLEGIGMEEDIPICASIDIAKAVPAYRGGVMRI